MEEEIDSSQAVGDTEFALKQGADLGSAEGASPVLRSGTGVNSATELLELIVGEATWPAAAGAVVQAADPLGIVTSDPLLDGSPAHSESLGDLRGSPAAKGQDDGAKPEEAILADLVIGKRLELIEAEVIGNMHGEDS